MNRYEKNGRMPVRLQALMGDRVVVSELTEEFSLPDYQPEMKRLLRVKATVLPADRFVGVGSAECSGRIDYCILYAGNDGAVYCTNQSGEYRFSSPLEIPADFEAGEGILCSAEPIVESAVGRVVAPRRLAVKCRLRSRVRLYGVRAPGEVSIEEDGVERLCGESESAAVFLGESDELRLADEILCEEKDQGIRVICADGRVFVSEVVAGSGTVNCRGEVCLKLLCCREEGEEAGLPYAVWRRIPFSQGVPTDGAEVNCEASAKGVCSDIQITVEEGRILCEVGIRLSVKAMRRERIAYVRDLYSTRRSCEVGYRDVELPRMLRCGNGNLSLNTVMTLEEAGIRSGLRVVDLCGTAALGQAELTEKGKYRLIGRCRFHAILTDGEEFSSQEFEAPFAYELDGGEGIPTDTELWAEVISCRGKPDGERIGVDAELAIAMSLCGKGEIRMASEAVLGGEWKERGAACTVCFPQREDTLWSVAKRYHCAVAELSEKNRLADAPAADGVESLAGVKFLLV